MTNLRHDFIRTHVIPCGPEELEEIRASFSALKEDAMAQFHEEGFPLERVSIEHFLDLRYRGQEHTVRTPATEQALEEGDLDPIIETFHDLHDQAYSFRQDDPVEIVNFHVVGWGEVDKPSLKPLDRQTRDLGKASKGERPVHFEDVGTVSCRIYERDRIPLHQTLSGPAIIEEPACTTVVCPQQQVAVDLYGNLVITEVTT